MRVEIHNNLKTPQKLEATRVVIYDKYDNPISVAIENIPDVIFAATAEHPDFNEILKNFGISKTVICTTEAPPDMKA